MGLGAFGLATMAVAGSLVAFDSARTTLAQWSSPRVAMGAGAIFAMPFLAAFLLALAIAVARAVPRRTPPVEKMGRWTWALGALALVSIPLAGVAAEVIGRSLEADGYTVCGPRSSLRLGVVHWRRRDVACAASSVAP